MARKAVDVTDTELAILEVLWANGASTIRQVTDKLYPEGGPVEYGTVQSLLDRLEGKRCVKRDRSSFAHVFTPKIDRSDLINRRLEELAAKLCGGSCTPLLVHLVERVKLSRRDRKLLRKLIDDLES